MDELEHTYDGKFEGNVLVVGRTACQKEHLCRMWANTIYLVTYLKFTGYLKSLFQKKEKMLLEFS